MSEELKEKIAIEYHNWLHPSWEWDDVNARWQDTCRRFADRILQLFNEQLSKEMGEIIGWVNIFRDGEKLDFSAVKQPNYLSVIDKGWMGYVDTVPLRLPKPENTKTTATEEIEQLHAENMVFPNLIEWLKISPKGSAAYNGLTELQALRAENERLRTKLSAAETYSDGLLTLGGKYKLENRKLKDENERLAEANSNLHNLITQYSRLEKRVAALETGKEK